MEGWTSSTDGRGRVAPGVGGDAGGEGAGREGDSSDERYEKVFIVKDGAA